MSIRADFDTPDQYRAFRDAENARKRRWNAENPDKVGAHKWRWRELHPEKVAVERARTAVYKLSKSIDWQWARQTELEALLELDESTLVFVHDTCKAHIRADLQRIEAQLQETHAAHARAVTKLQEIEP